MNEQNCVSESGEGSVESTFPECEVVPMAKSPVSRANPANTIKGIARSAETIRTIERSLAASQQLAETMKAINRPLGASQQLAETIKAINRPLGASQQLAETMKAINRPLGASQQLAETMKAINRPLGVSQQLAETMRSFNHPLITPWSKGFTVSRHPRTIPTLISAPRLATGVEKPETRTNSILTESEEHSLVAENTYWLTQFDALVREEGLRRFCRSLFADGYYDLAVQRACTYLHNIVREKSARYDKDGADLMMAVFSPKNPTLLLNQLTTPSERNEQQGYMFLLAGTMTGIRNPRSHEHDLEDSPEEALEILILVNHLMRRLNNSALA